MNTTPLIRCGKKIELFINYLFIINPRKVIKTNKYFLFKSIFKRFLVEYLIDHFIFLSVTVLLKGTAPNFFGISLLNIVGFTKRVEVRGKGWLTLIIYFRSNTTL